MKVYELCISPIARMVPLAVLAFFSVAIPVLAVIPQGPPLFLLLLLVLSGGPFIVWHWWLLLTLAYRIVVHDDGTVEWVALARRVRTLPEDIREIKPHSRGVFHVFHRSGRVKFLNLITGVHEVIAHIRSRNPSVVLKGC